MAKKKYQIWLSDRSGDRIQQLDKFAFLNYTRVVNGIGTLNIGLPFAEYGDVFNVDYRVEVWRAPEIGKKRRLENIFFLQKKRIYARKEDGVMMLTMQGHDLFGLLNRAIVKYNAETSQTTKTDFTDDMMKEIVDENMGAAAFADDPARAVPYDNGVFRVQSDFSAGPSITKSFAFRDMDKILWDLHQETQTDTPLIYSDVVPITTKIFEYQTFKDQRGADKRFTTGKSSLIFSLERGNLEGPVLEENHIEEKNVVYAAGQGIGEERTVRERSNAAQSTLGIWGRREGFRDARQVEKGSATENAELDDFADEELGIRRVKERFVANFKDIPGSRYGIDWDFGDRATANFANQQFDVEFKIVYISINDAGEENIFARNEFGEFAQ